MGFSGKDITSNFKPNCDVGLLHERKKQPSSDREDASETLSLFCFYSAQIKKLNLENNEVA